MKKAVIILGGNIYNRGIIDKLLALDIISIVIDRNDRPDIKGDINFQCDLLDVNKITKFVKDIQNINIYGVYTSSDIAIKSCNELNSYYGLKSNDNDFLEFVSSKDFMLAKWRDNRLLNRYSEIYAEINIKKILEFAKTIKLVIKPNNASSSRGLTLLSLNPEKTTLLNAIKRAENFSFDNKVLVEEFIEGQEMTIEMLGDNYGNVNVYGVSYKYHSINTINNKVAVKLHYNPIDINKARLNEIAQFGIDCYKSFGLKNSFGHLEVIEKRDGSLTPIEINSRSAGFIASHLVDISSGRNYFLDYLKVLNGAKLDQSIYISELSSMYFFYDLPPNRLSKNSHNLMEYLPAIIESLYSGRENLVENRIFNNIDCDNDRYGFEILSGPKDILTYENIKIAEDRFIDTFFY